MALRRLLIGITLGLLLGFVASQPPSVVQAQGEEEEQEHEVIQVVPGIKLIQPLDDVTKEIPVDFSTPQATWLAYFMTGSAWLLEVCIGIVAIWILICGSAMILVGGDAANKWRTKMFTAIVGLIALIFTVVILNFLNANFFAR